MESAKSARFYVLFIYLFKWILITEAIQLDWTHLFSIVLVFSGDKTTNHIPIFKTLVDSVNMT